MLAPKLLCVVIMIGIGSIDFVSVCVCIFAARVRRNVKGESRVAKIG